MLTSVQGVLRNGHIELAELPSDAREEAQVIVTFMPPVSVPATAIDLAQRGIDAQQAAELRARFSAFSDWSDPAMDIYDNYDAAILSAVFAPPVYTPMSP